MSIDDAARATRKYFVSHNPYDGWIVRDVGGEIIRYDEDMQDAQAACDRLNMIAVLEAIREPTKAMVRAATDTTGQFDIGHEYVTAWQAMVDALIAEAKEKQDA